MDGRRPAKKPASHPSEDPDGSRSEGDSAEELRQAFEELERELPRWLARFSAKVRQPHYRGIRIILALALIASSALWFLPVVGIEFLPLGLLLLAVDIPILRRPLARLLRWLLARWRGLKRWWARRRSEDRARF